MRPESQKDICMLDRAFSNRPEKSYNIVIRIKSGLFKLGILAYKHVSLETNYIYIVLRTYSMFIHFLYMILRTYDSIFSISFASGLNILLRIGSCNLLLHICIYLLHVL